MRKRSRSHRPYVAPRHSERLYARLPGCDVGLLRFLLEGRGHLACMSVVDRYAAVVRFSFAPGRRGDVAAFLDAAAIEIPDLRIRFDPGERGEVVADSGVSPS
ncbi:MAG: DUF4911 domain-containing protein [Thermodesulfobacteriota bacterium]